MAQKKDMREDLAKAADSMGFVCDELRQALKGADNIEGIIVLALIGKAHQLRQEVEELLAAFPS